MADNVVANAGAGGATFATDDLAGVHHPFTKMEWGPNNTATPVDVGASAVPIQDGGNSITVDGTVTVTGGGTSAVDESSFTAGSSVGVPMMGAVNDETPDIALEGVLAIARVTSSRALHVNLRNDSGTELNLAGNVQYDEDTAHLGGNTLTLAGAVRRDTAASGVSGTDMHATINVNSVGRLWATAIIDTALPAGANNIGDIDVLSLPALPTGTNSIGTVVDGGSGKTLKNVAVSLTASGNVVAAVSGKLIKVYAYEIQSITDSMTVQLVDDLAGNLVSILWTLNAREGVMASSVNPPAFLLKNSAQNKPIYANITGTGTIKILARYWDDDAA